MTILLILDKIMDIEDSMSGPAGNFFIKLIVTSPLHPLIGDSFAVITVEGRKTGKHYATPINVKRDAGVWTVVSMRSRTWWRNLRGGRTASLHVAGQQFNVQGEIIEEHAAVVAGLRDYFQRYPGYVKYFNVPIGADVAAEKDELNRIAKERLLIRLHRDNSVLIPSRISPILISTDKKDGTMKERRKVKRQFLNYYMRVFNIDTRNLVGYLVDLTTQGIMLLCDEPPPMNKTFHLQLELSNDIANKSFLEFTAKSIWCKPDIDPKFHNSGFEIIEIEPEDIDTIQRIIATYGIQQQRKSVANIRFPND